MALFEMTKNGKCDVVITLFTEDNRMFLQNSKTFDIKPTIREFKDKYKQYKTEGARTIRITSTPSCEVRSYKL